MPHTSDNGRTTTLILLVKLIGIGVFIYLIATLDHEKLFELLGRTNLQLLALTALLSVIVLNSFKALRWHMILRWIGVEYSYLQTYVTYQASVFIGLMTPGRLGELFRGVYLKSDRGLPVSTGIASTGADRMFDLFGMLLLAGTALLLNPGYGDGRAAGWYFYAGAFIAFVLLLLIRRSDPARVRAFTLFGSPFTGALLADFVGQVRMFTPRRALIQIFNTAAPTFVFSLQCYLLARSIGLELDLLTAGGIAAATNLVIVIPVTMYGLGTREVTVIGLMGMLGYGAVESFAFSMLIFFNFWIIGALWGMGFWLFKPMSATAARSIERAEKQKYEQAAEESASSP